nr:MAG TPA: Cell wall hydrolase autolysin [Caudoviricetes sp.]
MNIGINAGHTKSGAGSGAVGIIKESEHTRVVAAALKRILVGSGVNVRDCTVDSAKSQNAYLVETVRLANGQDLDWFVSIHFNAGGGRGVEVYTYNGRQYQDAVEVCANIAALGFRNRGVKAGTGLYVIRKTKAKSMLIEVCFVDTEDANHYLQIGAEKIAQAIAAALIPIVAPTTPAEQMPVAPAKPEKQKYVRVKVDELNIRNAPAWDVRAICGTVRKREVFTVVETLTVGKTPMHRLKSGLYITAHPVYVDTYEK